MEKIGNIDLTRATKAAHFEFIRSVCAAAEKEADMLANEVARKALEALKAAHEEEQQNLTLSNKSLLTDDIRAADAKRDRLLTGLKRTAAALQQSPEPEKAQAAKELTQRIKDIRVRRSLQLEGETALLMKLAEECETTYAEQVKRLGVGGFVTAIKAANQQVYSLINERTQNQRLRKEAEVDAARRRSDAAYRWLVEVVNAMRVLLGEESGTGHFIEFMNKLIRRYRQVVFARRKRKGAAATEEA
ncbi:hypothetical protein BHU09_03415 [Tannerella sp. oral taxon 808]|nr:hypothetical protein BHU09_03415 [Tannerella sp. oral taxon 808]